MEKNIHLNSFYSNFKKYSRNDIKKAITQLEDSEIGFLFKIHNGDLDSRCEIESSQLEKYNNILIKIEQVLIINHKKNKTKNIFERFPNYTEEEIWDAFSRMTKEKQEMLKKAYGEDLNNTSLRESLEPEEKRKIDSFVANTFLRLLKHPDKKMQKIRDVFDFFPDYSREEIWEAFNSLTKTSQEKVKAAYGQNLDNPEERKKLSMEERKIVFNIVDIQLRKNLKEKKTPIAKNVFEYFEGFSKEVIMKAFSTLTEKQQTLLKRAYGENLDDASFRANLTAKERSQANDILRSTFKNRVSKDIIKKRQVKNLFERLKNYSKEEILEAFNRLSPESKELLIKAYGESLEDTTRYTNLSKEEKTKINGIIDGALKRRIAKKEMEPPRDKNLYELYSEYSKEEILEVINSLTDDERKLLIRYYGIEYTNPKKRLEMTIDDRSKVHKIVNNIIRRRLQNGIKIKKDKTIFEIFQDYSKEEVMEAFSKLSEKSQSLLIEAFGEDLTDLKRFKSLSGKKRSRVNHTINQTLCNKLKKNKIVSVKTLFERYESYSEEEIYDAISRLSDEDRHYLYKAYGYDLKQRDLYSLLNSEEKKIVHNVVSEKIKVRLQNKSLGPNRRGKIRKPKTIFERYSEYEKEEILDAFSRLSYKDQEFLIKAFGENLENKDLYAELSQKEKENVKRIISGPLNSRLNNLLLSSKPKNIFEYYPDNTKEEILDGILRLDLEEKELLAKAYGQNYEDLTGYISMTNEEKNKVRYIIYYKLKRRIKENRKANNLFEHFKGVKEEVVLSAFYRLNTESQEILIKAYGPDLKDYTLYSKLSDKEKTRVLNIINGTLKRRIKMPYLYNPKRGRKVKNVFEHLSEYTKEEILIAFEKLSDEYQDVLIKAFGENLDNSTHYYDLSQKEKSKVHNVIKQLKTKLTNPNSSKDTVIKPFYEHFKHFTKEEVDEIVLNLPIENKQILYKFFGDELDKIESYNKLTKDEKNKLRKTFNVIQMRLKRKYSDRIPRKIKNYKNIYELFNDFTKEEIEDAISRLPEKDIILIKRAYGDNYDNPEGRKNLTPDEIRNLWTVLNYSLKKRLINPNLNVQKPKTIFEIFNNYSKEEILDAFSRLSEDHKLLLLDVYGPNLDNIDKWSSLDEKLKVKIRNIINSPFRRRLENKNLIASTKQPKKIEKRQIDEDILYIKRLKLYFYNKVDDKKKKLYLGYLFDIDKSFKEKYTNASIEERNELIENAMIEAKTWYKIFLNKKMLLVNAEVKKYPKIDKQKALELGALGLEKVIETYEIGNKSFEEYAIKYIEKIFDNYIKDNMPKKPNKKLKTVTEMFNDYSSEEIKTAFNSLKKEEQALLITAFGENLDTIEGYDSLTKEEKIKTSQIKQKMRKYLINPQKNTSKKVKKRTKETEARLTDSSVYDMLNKIEYKRLSREEEIKFIKRTKLSYFEEMSREEQIVALSYYSEVYPEFRIKFRNADEKQREKLLDKAINNSLYWRERFLENNQRLVVSIASKYHFKAPLDELVIEGNFGLMKALEKFDVNKGTKFSTYATHWIRQAITRYINNSVRTVRIPVHIEEQLNLIKKERENFTKDNRRTPNTEELSVLTGLTEERIKTITDYEYQIGRPKSLSDSVNDDSDTDFESFVASEENDYEKVEDGIYYSQFIKIIENSNLDSRTIEILKMRYGLIDGRPQTLDEIGKHFELTRERIRQIELKGLKTLRTNPKLLKYYSSDTPEVKTDSETPEQKIEKLKQLKEVINKANLTEEEIKIMELFYIRELSLKEISELLNISINKLNEKKTKTLKKMNKQGIFI